MTFVRFQPAARFVLPLPDGVTVLHPEQSTLVVGKESVTLGPHCYLERRLHRQKREIVLSSLNSARVAHVAKVIALLSGMAAAGVGGLGAKASAMGYFLDFMDSQGASDALHDYEAMLAVLRQYSAHIHERMAQNTLSPKLGHRYLSDLFPMLEAFFEVDGLRRRIPIQADIAYARPTEPVCELAQSKTLGVCTALFTGITDMLVQRLPYPYALPMPKYLGWPDDKLWVFPTNRKYKTPNDPRPFPLHYDHENGRFHTPAYMVSQGRGMGQANQAIARAKVTLAESNEAYRHHSRLALASEALNAFLVLFVAHTGMNLAQIQDMPWDGEFDVTVARQGFRAVKWRAGGRPVSFEVQPVFIPLFKRYLELRAFVVGPQDFGYLFLAYDAPSKSIGPISSTSLHTFHRGVLQNIDPALPMISAREWRASKSDWLLRNADVATTARVLQNNEKTVLKNYAAGSAVTAMTEMSAFLGAVADKVLSTEVAADELIGPVGSCVDYGNPCSVAGAAPAASCRTPEGCLFCENYRVHADEQDARKLASCRFCIRQTAALAPSAEKHQLVFGQTLDRIDELLHEIAQRPGKAEMVRRVEQEVAEGELDPYWAGKLELLANLGVL